MGPAMHETPARRAYSEPKLLPRGSKARGGLDRTTKPARATAPRASVEVGWKSVGSRARAAFDPPKEIKELIFRGSGIYTLA